MLYDISRTIHPRTAVWPGDARYQAHVSLSTEVGNSVNLTTLTLSPHIGSHADAPYHVLDLGGSADTLPLEPYIGRARVVTLARRSGGIVPADCASTNLVGAERLLLHTWVSDLPDEEWPDDFPYATTELIDWLQGFGMRLLGVDMPSVDDFASKTLPCHRALMRAGMAWLETLCLRDVPDGDYELIALPLKLAGACASPVRAVLRSLD
ncbi:MAG: cyclase family protein [Anaerolineae bacterium]|nr:cyclase family protein [Anaerolineae bacterium]MDW8172732.1 cyclase family protein [Anaerolineae bacterium]